MQNMLRAISLLVSLAILLSVPSAAQSPGPVVTWLSLVNEVRLDEGLTPYNLSSLLSKAAQRHADDLAANGFADPDDVHLGSDGSYEHERIAEAGYAAWTRNGGPTIVDENLWAGTGGPEDAMAFFLDDPIHRANILSERYREIGIGVAVADDGRHFYVLNFGARPNVLPIFINDGAETTDEPEVAIHLTNENARPSGEGTSKMGEAIEIRISEDPEFEDASWRSWSTFASWTLPNDVGEHTVYVQFRDAAGRTAISADTIYLGEGTPPTPTPLAGAETTLPSATPEPAAPSPTTTAQPATPLATPSATPSVVVPSVTPEPPTASPGSPTPFPTWTPLPSPTMEERDDSTDLLPPPADSDKQVELSGLVAVLQAIALILGISLVLRRGGRGGA
jgi:hypothetical protein